jgi:hypothetical protein
MFIGPGLPAAGRPGVAEQKNMHNVMKYVKYAEYGSTLYSYNLGHSKERA